MKCHEARALGLVTWSDPRNRQRPVECLAANLHASWTPPVCSGFLREIWWHGRVMWVLEWDLHWHSIFLHVTWPNHQIHSRPGTYPNIWPNACQFASCSWAKASSCDETMCGGRLVIKSKSIYRLVTQSSLHISKNDSCKMTTGTSKKWIHLAVGNSINQGASAHC